MGGLTSLDTVYLAMIFLVPGYVYFAVRGHLVAGHRTRGNEAVIRLLCVSCVNFVFSGWIVSLVVNSPSATDLSKAVAWTFAILIAPAFLGFMSGLATQKEWLRKVYSRLKLKSVHVTPTAWDYAFIGRKECYVIVTLQQGGRFAGVWGASSFAADEPTERDLYLEHVYEIGDGEGEWKASSRSVLIKAAEIRHVEFMH